MKRFFENNFVVKASAIQVMTLLVVSGFISACSEKNPATPSIKSDLIATSVTDVQANMQLTLAAEIEGGNIDIVTISLDGQILKRVTSNPAIDISPSLSPDGGEIAFTSTRDGEANIYVMDSSGNDITQLTKNSGNNTTPSWSPNGKLIAYTSAIDGNVNINFINVETGSIFPLIIQDSNVKLVTKQHPVWSPNGQKIAFEGFAINQEQSDIYSVNLDGSDLILLAGSLFDEVNPSWSPKGDQLLFSSNKNGITAATYKIHILDISSGITTRLTSSNSREVEQYPAWLPCGEHVIYVRSESPDQKDIIIANINNEAFTRVAVNEINIIGFLQVNSLNIRLEE